MKKHIIVIISFMGVWVSYSQEKEASAILRVEPSGVVVHKPVGVENSVDATSVSIQKNPIRTIDDFSVKELENMLFYANLKLEKVKDDGGAEEDMLYYEEQRQLIEDKLKAKESQ